MPRRVTPEQKQQFWKLINNGANTADAARKTNISYKTALGYVHDAAADAAGNPRTPRSGQEYAQKRRERKIQGPIPYDELSPEAQRAWHDFEYFRLRYFGHVSTPWQIEAAAMAVRLLESPEKEYVVVNCPPGAGKSTLFSHDIPLWLTVRNRGIRGIIGSRTANQAEKYTAWLKKDLERTTPVKAKDHELRQGIAVDAEATLAEDFGRFKPLNPDIWQRGQLTVEQVDDQPVDEKEPTWTSFGMDSGSLGWRVDYITWDDVVDKTTIRTIEAAERQYEWWDDEAETRLEPAGVLVLPGQRLSARDLYRYCLNKEIEPDDDEDADDEDRTRSYVYRHVIYKAHYDEACTGDHKPSSAKPYPDGCLLDPHRISWKDIRQKRKQPKFPTVYQQEDVDPSGVLVNPLWITGGKGDDGVDYTGCEDLDRGLCELPPNLEGPFLSIATADPSPTKYWSVQWWIVTPHNHLRYLMDHERTKMDAPDFFDFNPATNAYSGIVHEWQERSRLLGWPITHWVVEANAAQRWLLRYTWVKQWAATKKVLLIPHETTLNKAHPTLGVESIASAYQHGQVRLPRKQGPARLASQKLIDEVTHWPDWTTDDAVMAHWFLEWNLPNLRPRQQQQPKQWRPSWLGGRAA